MDSHEITGTMKEWEGKVSGGAKQAAGKAEKTYGQVKDKVDDLTEEISGDDTQGLVDRAGDAWEDGLDVVRQHPGAAVGYSLLAGLVIGAIIGFASRD